MSNIPSLEHFIKYYNKGDYFKALNLGEDTSLDEIAERIEEFEMEHFEFSDEYSIPMARLKSELLVQTSQPAPEHIIAPSRNISFANRLIAQSLYSQACLLLHGENLDGSLNLLNQALDRDPDLTHAYSLRASILLIVPDYPIYLDQVISDCNRVIELESGDANAYNDRGRAYMRKGNPIKAIEDYEMALNIQPSMVIASLNKMSAEITLNRFEDVVGTYGALLKNDLSPRNILIASSLVSIALALDGKPYKKYMAPLLDPERKLKYLVDWNPQAIDDYLEDLAYPVNDDERIANALEIQKLFKENLKTN